MSSPNERQLNDRLRRAVSALSEDHAEELWNTPVEKANEDAWFLEGTEPKRKSAYRYLRWAGLAAACVALVMIGWFQMFRVPDVTVYLDVNPSVTIDVNRLGRVVSAEADNEDGRIILDDMDLRGTDVDVAVNALLGSMVKQGYLSQAQNTLLISANGRNETRTTALRQKLSIHAEQTLETLLGSGIVLEQNVDLDDAAEEIAERHGITAGKAALIIRLLKDRTEWSDRELAAMPMEELIRYCRAAGIDISQYLGEDGEIIGDLSSLLDEDDDDPDDEEDRDDRDDPDDEDDSDDRDDPDDEEGSDDRDDPDDEEDLDDRDDPDDEDDLDDKDDPDDKEDRDNEDDRDDEDEDDSDDEDEDD